MSSGRIVRSELNRFRDLTPRQYADKFERGLQGQKTPLLVWGSLLDEASMRKHLSFLKFAFLGLIGLIIFNQFHNVLSAGQLRPLTKLPKIYSFKNLLDVRRFLQLPQSYPEKLSLFSGICSGNADLTTKQVWATAMNDGLEPKDYGEIGFSSISLENTSSMPWTGVTLSAVFDATMVQGNIQLGIRVYRDGVRFTGPYVWQYSSGQYTVKTDPFVMEPGHKYEAIAYVGCYPVNQQLAAVIVKIVEIKWTI